MAAPVLMFALVLAFLLGLSPSPPAAAAEPDELMPGNNIGVKPGNLAKFVAKPPSGSEFALPDSTNDPTVEGGTLQIFDTMPGAGDDLYVLSVQPAPLGWTGLGSPPGAKGYKYRGAGTPADPCKVVIVKPKVVKAVCKDAGITLAPPFSAEAGIVLTLGTDGKRYCASFGGTELRNDEDQMKRKQAPAPAACSAAPPETSPGAVYVDGISGNDGNPGTMIAPMATIQAAIAAAGIGGDVHVSTGTYAESITLLDGVKVFGGYDASDSWSWSSANNVTIQGGTTAVLGTSLASPTELSDLTIVSADNVTPGGSSYGVYLTNSAAVTLSRVAIQAGDAAAGAIGDSGSPGAGGGDGGIGNPGCEDSGSIGCTSCALPAGGEAGTSACGRTGGTGGTPGHGSNGGGDGGEGTVGTPGGPGAPGSSADGTAGTGGASGANGASGIGGAAFGTALAGGYSPAGGGDGSAGDDGNGGGGGGGGGGGDDSCDSYGSSGGGGGGGGCGGGEGLGGEGGGGSFGLYLHGSTVAITESDVQSGSGGSGGDGGGGGSGGNGGAGGNGGPYGGADEQDDGGDGAAGGSGGPAGDGGDGGGGGGGPSIAISCASGSSLSFGPANVLTPGAAGAGGAGPGVSGSAGTSAATLDCP